MNWQLVGNIKGKSEPAKDGRDGMDGIGVAGALVDRQGHLIVTLSDGSTKDVGLVVGKDADPDDIQRQIQAAVDLIPRPKDGRDGTDGLGFDHIQVKHDGERGFTFMFVQGERVKEFGSFIVPAMLHRGVYQDGKTYDYQDVVTWGGSQWVRMDTTKTGKPGDANSGWLLVVKKGNDGKTGPQGKEGPQGRPGEQGPIGRPPGGSW